MMKNRKKAMITAIVLTTAIIAAGCNSSNSGETKQVSEETISGMITSVDGDDITLAIMDLDALNAGGGRVSGEAAGVKDGTDQMPQGDRPSDMPDGEVPSDMPDGEVPSDMPDGEMPSDMPQRERSSDMPEGEMPSDMPQNGNGNGQGKGMMENAEEEVITISEDTKITIANSDGDGTTDGSADDLSEGCMVTVVMKGGEVLSVEVEGQRGFGTKGGSMNSKEQSQTDDTDKQTSGSTV